METEHTTDEVRGLRACINDLVSVLALPAIWGGHEPSRIGRTLLDALVGMLRLDFAYLRLPDLLDGSNPIEMVQVGQRRNPTIQLDDVRRVLAPCLTGQPPRSSFLVPNPFGDGQVSIAHRCLGLQNEMGVLVAGSTRADFPTETEKLLFDVAANQAVIGLHEARRLVEHKRVAQELDQRVAQGTRELIDREARYADLVNSVEGIVWEADAQTFVFSFVSEQAERILGYPADRWLREPTFWKDHLHPEDRDWAVQFCVQATGQKRSHDFEYRMIAAEGRVVWLSDLVTVVVENGRPTRLRGVMVDVTRRKQDEVSLRKQANVLSLTHDAILVRDLTGTIKGWNRGAEELYGWSKEEAIDQVAPFLFKTVFPMPLEQIHAEVLRTGLWEGEIVRTKKDGTQVVVAARWSLQPSEHGEQVAIIETNNDITERKRAESLLAGEKRILEMVAKGDPLPEILGAICRLVEKLAGGALASIFLLDGHRLRPGSAPSLPAIFIDAVDGLAIGPQVASCGTAAYHGKQVIVQDIATDPLWVNYRHLALPHSLRAAWSTPIFSSQRRVIGTFCMYHRDPGSPQRRDQEIIEQITHLAGVAIERQLTQEALLRSEAYLAEAQRLTHTGSWAFAAGGASFWSEESLRLWGFDPQQDPPDREMTLQRVHAEDRGRVVEAAEKALHERTNIDVEFRITLPDGKVKHIHSLGHHVFSATGELVEIVGTHVDVTERKRAEEERERLRQLQAELAHINRVSMMGELAASLAHEMKQPITAAGTNARTSLRWLQRQTPDIEEARSAASRVIQDVNRAADIINHLRSLYTKGVEQRDLVDVNEIVEQMTVLLRNEASRYSIPIRSDLAGNLPKVMADRVQLQQVLMNLMLNGIEAMKDTAGELTIRSCLADDGQLLISIMDTGVGLPSQNVSQIFDAFFTTKTHGTGMGLAITRSIIEAHGGRVWATANSGRGATFHFLLPAGTKALPVSAGT